MGSVPPTKSSGLFIEAVAEIREGLIKRYSKEYDSIAKRQAPIYLGHNEDVFQDEMSKLIATFDKEPVQAFLSDKRQSASHKGACSEKRRAEEGREKNGERIIEIVE